ncbi:MAG: class I SAM-dependent methyltransferase [Desulfomonilaceae bacterium]
MTIDNNWDRHWKDFHGALLLNPATAWRNNMIINLLAIKPSEEADSRIIDLGCGLGQLASQIIKAHPNSQILGIDGSEEGLLHARQNNIGSVKFVAADLAGDLKGLESLQGWATHAVCSEVLEHLTDPLGFLKNSRFFLRNHSKLIVTVPGGPRTNFDVHIGHIRHYRVDSLHLLLEEAGYKVHMVFSTGFPFFNLYKFVILVLGRRFTKDVSSWTEPNSLAKIISTIAAKSFEFSLPTCNWGWQVVAIASKGSSDTA